jgi:hypothetical protein
MDLSGARSEVADAGQGDHAAPMGSDLVDSRVKYSAHENLGSDNIVR